MEAATPAAVESTATAATEATATHIAVVAAAGESASNGSASAESAIEAGASIARPSVAIPRPPVNGPSIEAAAIAAVKATTIPRARSDEDAAIEPGWPIVPVRGAGIGIVTVVAIRADRSRIAVTIVPIHRAADSNTN
jgi:hypothetical protein